MLVTLLIFLSLFVYLWSKRELVILVWATVVGLSYALGALLVFFELVHTSPDLTYGSDARYYWEGVIEVVSGKAHWMEFSAPLYILWGAVVVLTSPNVSFVWIVTSGIALIVLTFALQAIALKQYILRNCKEVCFKRVYFAINILAIFYLNGIVIWTVVRGLKEPLIWTLIALSITTSSYVVRLFLALGLWYLRPLGAVLALIPSLTTFLNLFTRTPLSGYVVAFLLIPVAYELLSYVDLLVLFRERFGEEALDSIYAPEVFHLPLIGSYLSILRFVLGPGPLRAFQQLLEGEVFEVSTRVGDVLILLGSIQWWSLLLYIAYLWLFTKRGRVSILSTMRGFGSWFWVGVATALAYAFIYFGTGDTRHRATLYVFWFPFIAAVAVLSTRSGRGSSKGAQ